MGGKNLITVRNATERKTDEMSKILSLQQQSSMMVLMVLTCRFKSRIHIICHNKMGLLSSELKLQLDGEYVYLSVIIR